MSVVGETVPVILIPRFSSYFGASDLATVPLDVSSFSKGTVTLWRGPLVDPGTFRLHVETSHDANTWFAEPPGSTGFDPGDDDSEIVGFTCPRRWLRVRVSLTGSQPAVTCWCAGMLEYRVDG